MQYACNYVHFNNKRNTIYKKTCKTPPKNCTFSLQKALFMANPNSGVLLVVASRLPQNTVKTKLIF